LRIRSCPVYRVYGHAHRFDIIPPRHLKRFPSGLRRDL
jgi:hypothetical protein